MTSFVCDHTHILLHTLHTDYVSSLRNNLYGQGAGEILLSGLSCHGNETTLFSCNRSNCVIGITNCSHIRDAGVTCSSQATSCTLVCSKDGGLQTRYRGPDLWWSGEVRSFSTSVHPYLLHLLPPYFQHMSPPYLLHLSPTSVFLYIWEIH